MSALDKAKVDEVLDLIRPALQADGGDVKVKDVTDDGVVKVELEGACKGCPMSQLTLANSVERILKDRLGDAVQGVVPVDIADAA
ncbi:MAG: NifU family protein [Coriobacteriales bacterium]|jgi:Fe-S cluster biogenesis protein NfuA|nr:NifU family protein [Coriobacteriales bacterium]